MTSNWKHLKQALKNLIWILCVATRNEMCKDSDNNFE